LAAALLLFHRPFLHCTLTFTRTETGVITMFTDQFADQVTPMVPGMNGACAQDAMARFELCAQDLTEGQVGGPAEFAFGGPQADRAAGYAFPRMHAMSFHRRFDELPWQHRAAANDASGVFDSQS
jgi:hypothetical protein